MAQVTDWIKHLTTDVDAATEGVQVADIYPAVGMEWMVNCCDSFLALVPCFYWSWRG